MSTLNELPPFSTPADRSFVRKLLDFMGLTATEAGVVRSGYPRGHAFRYGATGDGSDQTTVLQNWLNSGVKSLFLPAGSYLISAPLDIPDNCIVAGEGYETLITMSGSANPKAFFLTNKSKITIEGMRISGQNTGSQRACVYLVTCQRITVRDMWFVGATDCNGLYTIDCDYCLADNIYFHGGASRKGYCVYFSGAVGCVATNSFAESPRFGFAVVGQDIQPLSTRTSLECFGNIIDACHVSGADAHSFDINAATGNLVSNCSARNYAGAGGGSDQAFQNKHPSGDNSRNNVFVGCTVDDYPGGFDSQQGSNTIYMGCTANNVEVGMFLNDCNRNHVIGFICREFSQYGVLLDGSSVDNNFDGVILETTTAAAVGVRLAGTGCDANNFDNLLISPATTLTASIEIVSGADQNRFGLGCRINDQTISDGSSNTYWPVIVSTPEISVGATGNVNGRYVHRGMVVAKARAVITVTIVGTPQGQCGRLGANSEIAATQSIAGSAGAVVTLTQASQLLATAAIVQGRIGTAGTSGSVFFQYEGVPRL